MARRPGGALAAEKKRQEIESAEVTQAERDARTAEMGDRERWNEIVTTRARIRGLDGRIKTQEAQLKKTRTERAKEEAELFDLIDARMPKLPFPPPKKEAAGEAGDEPAG